MAIHKGIRIHQYLDEVRAGSHQVCLQHTQELVQICQRLVWLVNLEKSELEPKQIFNFVGYQFDLKAGRVRPTPDRWQFLQEKVSEILSRPTCPVRQFMSLSGLLTATEKQVYLGHSGTQIPSPSFGVSDKRNVLQGQPDLYRRLKRRVGCSPWQTYSKRLLVSTRKQTSHKLSGTKSSLSGAKRIPRSLYNQNCPSGHGQYNSSGLHKQGGRYDVRPTLCPSMENLDLVYQSPGNAKGTTYPRPHKCDSGQVIQAGSNHTDRMVSPSGSLSEVVQKMAPTSDRFICHEVQPQATSISVSSTGLPSCSSGCPHSHLGRSGCICLPTDRHIGQGGGEIAGFPVQETHSDCTGVAQHALVLGFGDHVKSGPSQPTQHGQSVDTALQPDPSQKSDESKSPCLAPRATPIKEQGFSEAVASRIEAPQRRSTRSVYEAKLTIFTKWCITHQVDFRSPPIKSVADFLLYLFEDKKLQPSTIDGYRSAIADKLGTAKINISKDDNLTRLLESFHRDRPKGRRGIPS